MKRPTIEGLPSPAARPAASQDAAAAPAFDLDVKRSVQRHPKLAAGVAALVLALVVAFGLTRTKVYQAESLTYIEPMASKVLTQTPTQDGYDSVRYDTYIQQQMQTALRPDILATAIGTLPPFVWQRPGESMQSAVARLQSALKVERVSTSYQLSITLSDPKPETAAAVVNAVTNTYLEQGRKDEHAEVDQRLKLLEEERQRIQQNLNEDRVEQASLGSALGVANPTGLVGNQYDTQIAGVQSQVATAREARDAAAAQLESLQGPGGTVSPALAAAAEEEINNDPGLGSLKSTINERKAALNTQMAGTTPANPIYKQDQAEIADLDRSLEAATTQLRETVERRLQAKMRGDLQRTAGLENKLNGELKQQTTTATSAAPKLQRATDLAADIERLTARYGVVDDAMRGLQLESNGPGLAHLSVAAVVPVSPEPSKSKLILLLALPLALIAGAGAAVMAHRYDPHIYSPADVEKVLGFLPIGVMPARAEVSERVLEEYTLRLAAGLQSAYRTSSAQSFVFTAASSTMEIGKFVQAIERVLGTLGFKALALDAASVLNPGSRTPSTQRGLTMHRPSALVRTIDGVRQGFAAEEIERLKSKYDLVLIDAPPLLSSAETEYLVRCTDATILIAESGVTVKSELYQSAVLLQQLNVAGVGAVLQELHLKDADAAFRASIAAVERMQGRRAESTGQITGGNTPSDESASEDETGDEVAGTPQHMSVPSTRPGAKVEVAPAVRAAGMAPVEAEEQETAAEKRGRSSAPGPVAVGPERSTRIVAEQNPERATLAGGMGQESGQVHIEERDQVRPWRELLRMRKEPVVESMVPEPEKETAEVEQDGREPEPMLYFEDRLRSRKVEQAVAPAVVAGREEEKIAEPVAAETTNFDAIAAAWAVEAAAARSHEPSAPEPVVAPGVAEGMATAVSAADPLFAERSISEARSEAPLHMPAADDDLFESAAYEKNVAGEFTHQPQVEGMASEGPEFKEQPEAVAASAASAEQVPTAYEAVSEFAGAAYAEAVPHSANGFEEEATPVSEVDLAAVPGKDSYGMEMLIPPAEEGHVVPEAIAKGVFDPAPPPPRATVAPKMEWFTLKFRGTSERVLRLVPGDEIVDSGNAESGEGNETPFASASAGHEAIGHRVEESLKGTDLEEESHRLAWNEQEVGDSRTDDEAARLPYADLSEPHSISVVEPAEDLVREAEVRNVSTSAPEGLAVNPANVEEWTPDALDELESQGDEEEGEPIAWVQEPETQVATIVQEEPQLAVEAEQGAELEFESREEDEQTAVVDDRFEAGSGDQVAEAPVHSGFAEAVIAGGRFHAAVPIETLIPVEAAPVFRAKIDRWIVEDQAPAITVVPTDESEDAWEPVAAPGGDSAVSREERLSPVKLMGELRSRSTGTPRFEAPQVLTRSWSRRSAAAPVEERLEPRAAGMTRRWEMLSRFDSLVGPDQTAADAEREVSATAEQGGR